MKIYLETENKNMAFKLNPPFNTKQSPIYVRDLEEGVIGKGNKNGTILISNKVALAAAIGEALKNCVPVK